MGLEILDKTDLLENLTYRALLSGMKYTGYYRLGQQDEKVFRNIYFVH